MLVDRMHKSFPMLLHCDRCENTIYNTVPLSLHKDTDSVSAVGADLLLLSFTVENAAQTEQIAAYFMGAQRTSLPAYLKNFTRGHFLKGVE